MINARNNHSNDMKVVIIPEQGLLAYLALRNVLQTMAVYTVRRQYLINSLLIIDQTR